VIDENKLLEFVRSYFNTFSELSSKVKDNDRQLLFPKYLIANYKVKCNISKNGGAAIEFLEKSPPLTTEINYIEDDIESALPHMGGTKPLFICRGQNVVIRNLNILSKDYYEANKNFIEQLTRSANFVMQDLQHVVKIEAGDTRLIDVAIAFKTDGIDSIRKIDCLWLIADETFLGEGKGKDVALYDYNLIVSQALGGVPITILISTLNEYHKLIQRSDLIESALQSFLEKNFIILEPSYKMALTKNDLRKLSLPEADFLLNSSDGRYIIIELESPQDALFTNENPANPAKELRTAQTQMNGYLSEFKNNMLLCNKYFPDMRVENISGLIVIGRRNNLSVNQKDSLQKMLGTLSAYTIMTYDDLFEKTNIFLENLGLRYGQFG
jgi:hypothetical protein